MRSFEEEAHQVEYHDHAQLIQVVKALFAEHALAGKKALLVGGTPEDTQLLRAEFGQGVLGESDIWTMPKIAWNSVDTASLGPDGCPPGLEGVERIQVSFKLDISKMAPDDYTSDDIRYGSPTEFNWKNDADKMYGYRPDPIPVDSIIVVHPGCLAIESCDLLNTTSKEFFEICKSNPAFESRDQRRYKPNMALV